MIKVRDVQALSDVDIHVYEAVASRAVESGRAHFDGLVRACGLTEDQVRDSLARLVECGYVVPRGTGYELGPHTFEVEY
ncbi:hypothetical protein SAMN05421874_101130 [Nonomuraea maritima]|uniref:Uncharacterized protein n=1 Tax=Nonomuraea maritima TaxID=683260 RepID=A0A1G8S0P3_9ACTN|nr:hypothetical protein [Nonomuraea maritima]SDJ22777.1 hypothetical protein SAMN05421874_101130 [Nonomuraea maritima]